MIYLVRTTDAQQKEYLVADGYVVMEHWRISDGVVRPGPLKDMLWCEIGEEIMDNPEWRACEDTLPLIKLLERIKHNEQEHA